MRVSPGLPGPQEGVTREQRQTLHSSEEADLLYVTDTNTGWLTFLNSLD